MSAPDSLIAIPPDSLIVTSPDSLIATPPDSLIARIHGPQWIAPLRPTGSGGSVDSAGAAEIHRNTLGDLRGSLVETLGMRSLDGGSPHLVEPLYERIPGIDAPEIRIDGRAIGSLRWPETSLLSVPNLAVRSAALRRASPIDGPLSATGGGVLDLRLHPAEPDLAASAFRLTRSSYGTFTEEIVLRRPIGRRLLFSGFYGDAKTAGRDLWQRQHSETIGLRVSHSLRGGALEWSYDAAEYRNRLLASKRQLWDRRAAGMRWTGPVLGGRPLEVDLSWAHQRGAWWTARGLTERRSDGVRGRFLAPADTASLPVSIAVELDGTRTRYKRFNGERDLLEDFSYGGAAGWERRAGSKGMRLSAGFARIAPLAPAPIFLAEIDGVFGGSLGWTLHAGRSVRNRTLPRLPTDGEAWVRQGIDLADEETNEAPESMLRGGGAVRAALGAQSFTLFLEACLRGRGLALEESELALLGIDRQEEIPAESMRNSRSFASPGCEVRLSLPAGLRIGAAGWGNIAEGGWRSHLALPAAEGVGEAGWSGALFKGDLELDLGLFWRVRDALATPYGVLAPSSRADGRINGRIGPVDLFFVLANITDAVGTSLSFDGRFMFMPRRHYRAGVCWRFID